MSEEAAAPETLRITLTQVMVTLFVIALLASLAVPTFARISERGNVSKGISNCRQIVTAMRLYASIMMESIRMQH